jgi:xylulose-5-phosphate/fructose-6-phosphate phosphoketolase
MVIDTSSLPPINSVAISARDIRNAHQKELTELDNFQRVTNYLAAAQIYLKDNVLLENPLTLDDIKDRLLGHWGTSPGINMIYAHLNHLIKRYDLDMFLVTGPGHGAPANLANLYLEGSLRNYYPDLTFDKQGLSKFIRSFSWPGGFPSHLYPGVPGTIHEGGELGYALATAFGAVWEAILMPMVVRFVTRQSYQIFMLSKSTFSRIPIMG